MEIEMLKRRIQNLEAALRDSQDLLLEMYEVSGLLGNVEEQISENASILEGEFED
jgi:hypothetical protein